MTIRHAGNVAEWAPSARPTVVERITEQLREGIRVGDFAPGQRLIEADLTRELGVSRGPLREAMRRLAGEGIIIMEPHRGAVVRRISTKEIADLFLLRERLEGLAARLAASSEAGRSARCRFEDLIQQMQDAFHRNSLREYFDLNRAFHHQVAECAGNSFLSDFIFKLEQPILRLRFHRLIGLSSPADSMHDHEAIAHAIVSGSPATAERAMRRHVRKSGRSLLAAVGQIGLSGDQAKIPRRPRPVSGGPDQSVTSRLIP